MPPEPNDQMVTEPELGDAELQQWLTSVADGADIQLPGLDIGVPPSSRKPPTELHTGDQPTSTGGAPDDDEEPDDDEAPDDDQTGAPAGEPQAGVDFFEINGERFAREDIERLYNFDQYMRANPDVAQRVNATLTGQGPAGQAPLPPASETPTDQGHTELPVVEEWKEPEPPEFLDLDDPVQKFQWDNHVATQKVLFDNEQRQRQFFATQAAEVSRQRSEQAQRDMASALASFKQVHPNLNEDDIAKVRQLAIPFVEGMMKQLPPVEALSRSMEVAGMMDNDLRDKLIDQSVRTRSEQGKSRHRKNRLGEISGSGRSAPRTEQARPTFTSDRDFLNALASEFSEHMQR